MISSKAKGSLFWPYLMAILQWMQPKLVHLIPLHLTKLPSTSLIYKFPYVLQLLLLTLLVSQSSSAQSSGDSSGIPETLITTVEHPRWFLRQLRNNNKLLPTIELEGFQKSLFRSVAEDSTVELDIELVKHQSSCSKLFDIACHRLIVIKMYSRAPDTPCHDLRYNNYHNRRSTSVSDLIRDMLDDKVTILLQEPEEKSDTSYAYCKGGNKLYTLYLTGSSPTNYKVHKVSVVDTIAF